MILTTKKHNAHIVPGNSTVQGDCTLLAALKLELPIIFFMDFNDFHNSFNSVISRQRK